MDLTEKLISYFRRPEEETRNEAPQGLCSLCWGYQQYDGKIRDVIKDKQIDVNNHKESYLLIQDFVKQNLEGIKLKEGEIHSCPTCNCEEEIKMDKMKKPIRRHEALKPLSREHHHGLLLCWKIRQGIKLDVEPQRMKNYTEYFKKVYLEPHFEAEEKYIFPVLGNDNDLVKRALAEHRRLRRLFDQEDEIEKALSQIEEELDLHIRFEERVLFNEIQKIATTEQLTAIEEHHNGMSISDDGWEDHFWKA